MIVPALIAKFLSAGAIAQAATGAGVVVVVVTGAGATGTLPDGAQETFSDLTGIGETVDQPVADVTDPEGTEPVEADDDLTDPGDLPEVEVPETEPVEDVAATAEFDATTWAEGYDPDVYPSFGAWVSLGAHNKAALAEVLAEGGYKNFGAMVSAAAKAKGMGEDEVEDQLAEEGIDLDLDLTDDEETASPDDSGTTTQAAGDDTRSHGKSAGKGASGKVKTSKGSGHGNGGGHGKGRSSD